MTKPVVDNNNNIFVLTLISGITLGFMPATGWVNTELIPTRCYYVSLFPGSLLLFNSFLSILPIALVAVLYSKILVEALKTVKTLNTGARNNKTSTQTPNGSKLRMNRGSKNDLAVTSQSVIDPRSTYSPKLPRSSSFHDSREPEGENVIKPAASCQFSNPNDIVEKEINTRNNNDVAMDSREKTSYGSVISVCTIESNISDSKILNLKNTKLSNNVKKIGTINKVIRRPNEPNKWRAITIVMLTSGSIIITWTPFFIALIFFVFCQEKMTNERCIYIRYLLDGPFPTLAFLNSILNPLIYAWWHKGFQKSVQSYYRKYLSNFNCWIHR